MSQKIKRILFLIALAITMAVLLWVAFFLAIFFMVVIGVVVLYLKIKAKSASLGESDTQQETEVRHTVIDADFEIVDDDNKGS